MLLAHEWAMSLFPKGGWYVEAGAHDGVGDSQTLALERSGLWQGLCVEPSRAFAHLVARRACITDHRCLAGEDGPVVYRELAGNAVELSGILACFGDHWDRETRPHQDRRVAAVTLHQMLAEHDLPSFIEALFLDTEGSELAILEAHDFDRFRFGAIQVEHNGVEQRKKEL